MTLRIPLPQLNGHPENRLPQAAGNLVHWQLRLPPSVYSGDITMDLTAVAEIAQSSQLDGIYVLPIGSRGDRLDGYLHSGFESGVGKTGQQIADGLRNNGGSYLFEAASTADEKPGKYGCIAIHCDLIQAKLSSIFDRDEASKKWAEGLNEDFSEYLGELATERLSAQRTRALLRGFVPTAAAVTATSLNLRIKRILSRLPGNESIISTAPATDSISLAQQAEDIIYF